MPCGISAPARRRTPSLARSTGDPARSHSNYDATAKRFAAYDGTTLVESIDDLGGLSTQLIRAIGDLAKRQIAWKTEREYHVRGPNVAWKWSGQEAVSALRSTLLRDPTFRVLIAHGYADLVTPYFRTRLLLDQMPTIGPGDRFVWQCMAVGTCSTAATMREPCSERMPSRSSRPSPAADTTPASLSVAAVRARALPRFALIAACAAARRATGTRKGEQET